MRAAYIWAFFASATTAVQSETQHVMSSGGKTGNMTYVHQRLLKAEIIPTVLDDFVPFLSLSASWKSAEAKLGNTIKPSKAKSAPTVHLHEADTDQRGLRVDIGMTYVFALTDPDAPSRHDPKWSEFCHWIASGTPTLSPSGSPSFFHLKDLIKYKPPGPPPKTGRHRYVLIAFVPANGTVDHLNLAKPKSRKHWGLGKEELGAREWAKYHELIPVAANFVYAQNDKQ